MLGPCDWFERDHNIEGYKKNMDQDDIPMLKSGTFLWSPPAVASDVAIEELRMARHTRTKSCHICVCPKKMNYRCIG